MSDNETPPGCLYRCRSSRLHQLLDLVEGLHPIGDEGADTFSRLTHLKLRPTLEKANPSKATKMRKVDHKVIRPVGMEGSNGFSFTG